MSSERESPEPTYNDRGKEDADAFHAGFVSRDIPPEFFTEVGKSCSRTEPESSSGHTHSSHSDSQHPFHDDIVVVNTTQVNPSSYPPSPDSSLAFPALPSLPSEASPSALHPPRGRIFMDVSIFKVPYWIYDSKPEAYKPSVISLGLYHLGCLDPTRFMDVCKDYALKRTLHRLPVKFEGLLHHMGSLKPKIEQCYDDIAWYSAKYYCKQDFLSIIIKDACFLLEFLRVPDARTPAGQMSMVFDDNREQNVIRIEMMNDIFKLENQVPLIVLKRILELEKGNATDALDFLCASLETFHVFRGFPFRKAHFKKLKDNIDKASHLLDLCRLVIQDFLIDPPPHAVSVSDNVQEQPYKPIRCASKLRDAGILFEKNAEDQGSVRFEEGGWKSARLLLPEITVDNNMETLLRNLMALEECLACKFDPPSKTISHYVRLMNELVDTAEDVVVLKKKKIIRSIRGSDKEIAEMFSSLCAPVLLKGWGEYKPVILNVTRHYEGQWKVFISEFKERFKQPWYLPALVAVLLHLIFSAIQKYYPVEE